MNRTIFSSRFLAVLIASLLFSDPAIAKKYNHGKSKQKHHQEYEQDNNERHESNDGNDINVNIHFGDRDRVLIHDYYEERYEKGRCPPGLAKKHNGCMPPGQAKQWRKGYPLPRDVIYHDLPPRIIVEIGLPPAGHKYVRVAADILLIAIGTGIVVDAIEDLGRM